MSLREELEAIEPEDFNALPKAKRDELIEYNNEFVRQWRAVCQRCKMPLVGTLAYIRAHECGPRGNGDK